MRTLILAYDNEGGMEPRSINLFLVRHEKIGNNEPLQVRIKDAFQEWHFTSEGKRYVEENGSNWGDAFAAYSESRAYRELLRVRGVYEMVGEESGKRAIAFDEKEIVDHNECLLAVNPLA